MAGSKQHISLRLTWTAASPFVVSTGTGSSGLLNTFIKRGPRGEAVLPGSAVKGQSQRHTTALYAHRYGSDALCANQQEKREGRVADGTPGCGCVLCALYGAGGLNPSLLHFADLKGPKPVTPAVRWSVAMDGKRHTAADRLLTSFETAPEGEQLTGAIEGHLPAEFAWRLPDGQTVALPGTEGVGLLVLGIGMITGAGGGRTRGLGHGRFDWQLSIDGQAVETAQVKAWCRPWI